MCGVRINIRPMNVAIALPLCHHSLTTIERCTEDVLLHCGDYPLNDDSSIEGIIPARRA